jgi:hypothetical protein
VGLVTVERVKRMSMALVSGLLAASLIGVQAPASAESIPVPEPVTAALASFPSDPQGAVTTWAAWAASSPMTYVRKGKRPKTRSNCKIDSAGVADCNDFAQVIGRGNRNMGMKKISEIITAGNRQYFRDPPLKKWTRTRTASNPNPITGVADRVGFDPWLPWTDQAPDISTQVLENGTLEIRAQNPAPAEGEAARTIVRIAANGLQATLLEYDERDRTSSTTRITWETVPSISIPKAR